ncbi:hypothetical protein F5H01DRAFT_371838 [Linnemannia elongata]|nr:hypothetical protein F5H01DRAFT_371838 [Linnemannia elongata]
MQPSHISLLLNQPMVIKTPELLPIIGESVHFPVDIGIVGIRARKAANRASWNSEKNSDAETELLGEPLSTLSTHGACLANWSSATSKALQPIRSRVSSTGLNLIVMTQLEEKKKVFSKNRYDDFVKLADDLRNSCPLFQMLAVYCSFRQMASLVAAPLIRESSTGGLDKLSLVRKTRLTLAWFYSSMANVAESRSSRSRMFISMAKRSRTYGKSEDRRCLELDFYRRQPDGGESSTDEEDAVEDWIKRRMNVS